MTIVGNTRSSRDALAFLRSVKPKDGWSIQENDGGTSVRLLRRNVPLTEESFRDVHYDPSRNAVVGVVSSDASVCRVLVDGATGRPVPKSEGHVSCSGSYGGRRALPESTDRDRAGNPGGGSGARARARASGSSFFDGLSDLFSGGETEPAPAGRRTSSNTNRNTSNNVRGIRTSGSSSASNPSEAPPNPLAGLSEEDQQRYLKYAAMGLGAWTALRALSAILSEALWLALFLPGLYWYGVQTRPADSSFDTKKEVKRVLRGHHLPDDHPQKPQRANPLEWWTAKIAASLATEVGAASGGYALELTPLLGGVATHARVVLPALGLACEWIGCHHTWYHLRTTEASE
ncbi:unnamed protein product [Pseudo-nitzschia multistriata]|uniref:Uncharacterized protein n=1 Tax=Pseudo-nitzschia multistriata TaxID=183589 RepID=A0A448YYS2_9STRA|nr:unnamed protein product [Pseudo-nitzschia multistriata]